jgi:Repeat of unknown function (DUF5650)
VTWGSGTAGVTGVVSASNSLVGSLANDAVGSFGVTALSNGNYVVDSVSWSHLGAVTWGNGAARISGVVSATNSLVGSLASDGVGSRGVTALSNGNYVVDSSHWNGARSAVTWGSGTAGVSGAVSVSNSLVGSSGFDYVGDSDVTALSNGNYVVRSPAWDAFRGAVTWGSGAAGVTGAVSVTNSLVGVNVNDLVGQYAVTALSNGNYVINSSSWNGYRGAVTWASGTAAVTGFVSAANSLVGSVANDNVGSNGVTALSNGNYVVLSQAWNVFRGAVTWGSGTAGVSGAISASNRLVGSSDNDRVGYNGVTVLSDGNYVVNSPVWSVDRAAATWASGTS